MKKIIIIISALLILAVVAYFWPVLVKAQSSYVASYNTATATTSPEYLIGGTATSTKTVPIYGAQKVDMVVQFTASTSPAVLQWQYEFSDNGIDWSPLGQSVTTASIANQYNDFATSTIVNRWSPGSATASTSRIIVSIPPINSTLLRVVFSVPQGGARGAVWTSILVNNKNE